jgi:sulfhydrogenase subunit beta (sulfur reductase)
VGIVSPKKKAAALILKKKDIPRLIQQLTQVLTVYGPVANKSQFKFDTISDGAQIRLDYDTTILPPKKYFIPPKEDMVTFTQSPELRVRDTLEQTDTESLWNGKRFLVFGVHSCDLAAIHFHDHILTQIYPDPYRARRREEGIIIGLSCLVPCEDSFCKSAGTLHTTDCADLMLTDLENSYYVDVLTETGKKIVEFCKTLFSPVVTEQTKQVKKTLLQRDQTFPDPIEGFQELPEKFDASYEAEMWNRLGRRCFGCGSCTMVCPTCFCFDVSDRVELNLNEGARVRKWDSCQLVDFALVAGGHNFRPTIPSRVRFRIYHKFWIEPEQINQIGCVGCGRCTRACPADIEMIELLADIEKGGN